MNINRGALLCLGYVLGLFLTCLWGGINANPTSLQWGLVLGAIAVLTGCASWILPKYFFQLRSPFLLITGLIALLAVGYFQLRTPRLSADPVFQLTQTEPALLKYPVEISGTVISQPRQKSTDKQSFWLSLEKIKTQFEQFPTKGKLYVTLNEVEKTIKVDNKVSLKGRLYQPKSAKNPWSFDFSKYLQKNNTFFGFTGWEMMSSQSPQIGFSKIRERMINVHQKFLNHDQGALLSSMVLGRKAVNLPEPIYDLWVKAGLAYTIAASGFHVSLLLGCTLWLIKKKPKKTQFLVGISILFFYILLTGFQPSVLRAALMGVAGLLALVLDRAVKPLSLLLLTATILLLFNPLWIWDLGFQLSFLATFGLLTTLEPIQQKLSSIPNAMATAIAIPVAASIWTLPLIALQFNVIATYSIPLSILLALPIMIVSLGGMISGAIGLFIPFLGAAIAYIVGFLLQGMVILVEKVVELPASNLSIASLHWSQLAIIYGVMLIIWLTPWGKRQSKVLGFGLFILFVGFLTFKHYNTTKITVFATKNQPILVAQTAGKSIIINAEKKDIIQFSLTSYLRRAGINKINAFVELNPENLSTFKPEVFPDFEITKMFVLANPEELPQKTQILSTFELKRFNNLRFQLLQETPLLLELKLDNQAFYILGDRQTDDPPLIDISKGYLITNPKNIDLQLWETLRPQQAIAIGSRRDHFLAPNPIVYWTEEDGAIQWTPKQGLISVAPERSNP
ncbi:ComEC/Rec2 family competence protein [[Limnothrix rosea] IAM M-220]|uniref:ComEC/Rec2 family competence protein n=1 Tax=[Limnothrix rosea] IAM M-220 TaxID=454133 RepID=UPI0009593542|nr:ComEC/Rec2 family competence protein [[Limnothrix rosea] IAM M-220]OKH18325.1 hypothetical protein NIES208_06285 [[Limnothrix rosea] IAM M-220]